MRIASLGLLLLLPLTVGALAPMGRALHGDTPVVPATPTEPGEQEPCHKMKKNETYKIPPGKCAETASGKRITNTGQSTIEVKTGATGEFSEVKLGDSGSASYSGNGGTFSVSGGNDASFSATGNNNTITTTMGGNGGGGSINVTGNGNTVTNTNNSHGGTVFNSTPGDPNGTNNTLNLGGEGGNICGGVWVVNPGP